MSSGLVTMATMMSAAQAPIVAAAGDAAPVVTTAVIRDDASLQALAPAWDDLEARARAAGRPDQLFATHRYVSAAWRHLRRPGHQLWVLVLRQGEALQAVFPLVLGTEKASGLPVRVLRPIGIWEGERPGVLSEAAPETIWPTVWQALLDARSEWHVIDLREQDSHSWPVQHLAATRGGSQAVRITHRADHAAPWQALQGSWAAHQAALPDACRVALASAQAALMARARQVRPVLLTGPGDMAQALARCWVLEFTQRQASGVHRLSDDATRVAFYEAFMPVLAARGDAEVRLLQVAETEGGELVDVAALIRWRCGGVWIERHVAQRAGWEAAAPARQLLLQALEAGWDQGTAQASDLMLLPDASGHAEALKGWYDGLRPTRRITVWNLRSRMRLVALFKRR